MNASGGRGHDLWFVVTLLSAFADDLALVRLAVALDRCLLRRRRQASS